MRRPQTADGYIRVSRRGGREGESFISPEVQRERIAKWAAANDVEILEWWDEIDQSGAKLERPMFQEALARCERGETGGIVVAKLDRFARSAVDALESIRRLNAAGARLVSVEDGFDGSTPMGRFAIGILTMIAELELERIKDNWATAISRAVDRGIHISARPPTGYVRDESKRLVVSEPAASAVREVFRRRAVGASWAELASYLEDIGITTPSGNASWSKSGVSGLVKNPVYLGQARSRVRRRAIGVEVGLQDARWLPGRASDARRTCALLGVRSHAQDHRQHRSPDGRALSRVLLHWPLRERSMSFARNGPRILARWVC
jgi:site-specific DNA recombinase